MTYLPIAIIILFIAWYAYRALRSRGVSRVEPVRVRELLKDRNVLLLDVRTPRELAQGKIQGAVNIPLHELPSRVSELEPHRAKTIVVVCATGSRSISGAGILTRKGFQAASMNGGMMAWRG